MRLVGGEIASRGRVEAYYKGVWGLVCGRSWSLKEGDVLCRALRYGGVWSSGYGEGVSHAVGPTLLHNVSCTGHESLLSECNYQLSGESRCEHDQHASVVCYGKHVDM